MALNTEGALELVELAKKNNLILATGFHLRSHNGHRALIGKIKEGEIGAIRHIRAIWAFPQPDDSNWRAKDELTKWWSLSAVGSHCIDLVRFFSADQDDWKSFSAISANSLWQGPHDETTVIAAQLASGPTVEVVSSVQFGPYNRVEIFGNKGTAFCEGTIGRDGAGAILINGTPLSFEAANPFVEQLKNIVESIETRKSPRADGSAGLRSVKDLLLAIEK
jgi:predicted dehydrogenase